MAVLENHTAELQTEPPAETVADRSTNPNDDPVTVIETVPTRGELGAITLVTSTSGVHSDTQSVVTLAEHDVHAVVLVSVEPSAEFAHVRAIP